MGLKDHMYMYMNNHIIQHTTLKERREEKKEERNEQTPTIYNSLKGLEKYIICTYS